MDDIDWVKVKQKAGKDGDNKEKDDRSESSDSEPEQIDELQSWRGLPILSCVILHQCICIIVFIICCCY